MQFSELVYSNQTLNHYSLPGSQPAAAPEKSPELPSKHQTTLTDQTTVPSLKALFRKFSAQTTTHGTFDQIRRSNRLVDLTEFMALSKDFQVNKVLTVSELKGIFHGANLGQKADDLRAFLSFEEFVDAVKACVAQSVNACAQTGQPLPRLVLGLQQRLKDAQDAKPLTDDTRQTLDNNHSSDTAPQEATLKGVAVRPSKANLERRSRSRSRSGSHSKSPTDPTRTSGAAHSIYTSLLDTSQGHRATELYGQKPQTKTSHSSRRPQRTMRR